MSARECLDQETLPKGPALIPPLPQRTNESASKISHQAGFRHRQNT